MKSVEYVYKNIENGYVYIVFIRSSRVVEIDCVGIDVVIYISNDIGCVG